MAVQLHDKSKCNHDQMPTDEVMLRLDPRNGRIRTARSITGWEGGGTRVQH